MESESTTNHERLSHRDTSLASVNIGVCALPVMRDGRLGECRALPKSRAY
jgi:hypothetical protein